MFLLLLSSAYTKSSIFQLVPPVGRLSEGTGSWEGTQLGQLTRAVQRDIPYLRMSCQSVRFLLPCSWVWNSVFPGSKVGTELLSWGICPSLSVKVVVLFLIMCFWCPFLCYVIFLPMVTFLCASEPQIPALKISNISMSRSWGFA